MTETTNKTIFESETCSRCGGTGEHSYCQMYGSRCFKCGGKRIVLTKRGAAAQRFFTDLCSKRADELVPGDKVWMNWLGSKSGWETVEFAGVEENGSTWTDQATGEQRPYFTVRTAVGTSDTFAHATFRVAQSAEQKAAKLVQALAYQASLTKAGTPTGSANHLIRPASGVTPRPETFL